MDMRKISEPVKVAVATSLIIGLAVAAVAASYTLWQGRIQWNVPAPSKEFEVYYNGALLESPYLNDLQNVVIGIQTFDFVIKNVGNVAISVNVTSEVKVNCEASWSNSGVYTIPVGANVTATLTLNITAFGSGSYDWKFQSI
jgi:hypothetical protein